MLVILGNTGVGGAAGEIQQKSSKASHSTRLMEQEETNWKKRPLFFKRLVQNTGFQHAEPPSMWNQESLNQWVSTDLNNLFISALLQLLGVVYMRGFSVLVAPSRLPDSSLAAVYHDQELRCTGVFHPPWLLWSSECIGTFAFSMYSYNPLFSAIQRQKDSSADRRLPLCLIARDQDHHFWPGEILSASCQSVPTDKPCTLLDAVFLWCCILVHEVMVIHHGSWWQYGSCQRSMMEGVSQYIARDWRPPSDKDLDFLNFFFPFPSIIFHIVMNWRWWFFYHISQTFLSSECEELLEAEILLDRNNPLLQA